MINSDLENPSSPTLKENGQKLSVNGKIAIPKIGWVLRILTIVGISGLLAYYFVVGFQISDPLIIFSAIMPIQELIIVTVGWFFYKNPAKGVVGNELVSVLVPIFNQKQMITTVISAIMRSTYQNIEVIAINDGSTDGTKQVLDDLKIKFPCLKVIHNKNSGKRAANALGFSRAKGDFIVFVDSDSVIDKNAIKEFMKAFNANPDVGALVGHAKVWNYKKNLLTKFQDSWYDSAFNIVKTTESSLKNVICCSGCLSAYRRDAIDKFVPLWDKQNIIQKNNAYSKIHFKSNPWKLKSFEKTSKKILAWISQFDDAEDIALTSQTLVDWKTMYVSSSMVYTDVPDNLRSFVKQQIRWKKGWMRTGLFLMTFFWRKNPLASIVFYINSVSAFTIPLVMPIVYVYAPLVLHNYWIPIMSLSITVLMGTVQGLDYKFRDLSSTTWKFKPLATVFTGFLLPWLMIPALLTFRKNQWMTR
ncbi:MAG: glycosyltransferase [Nitrosopumilus sp.]|nr:glycosyltransferase [Nitrosopumilus sp.]